MNKGLLVTILVALTVTAAAAQAPTKDALIARAKSFELDTPYVPPPGDPLTHHAAGFAKVMCSAVFMTGLAPDFAAENVGFFTAPYGQRAKLGKPDPAADPINVRESLFAAAFNGLLQQNLPEPDVPRESSKHGAKFRRCLKGHVCDQVERLSSRIIPIGRHSASISL